MADVEFIDNSEQVLNALKGATEAAARIIGGQIRNYARQGLDGAKGPKGGRWPTEEITALKQSIAVEVEDESTGPVLSVGSQMEIAPYIELGTGKEYRPSPEWLQYHGNDKHSVGGLDYWIYYDELTGETKIGLPMAPTPYLRPAFLDHVDEYKDIVRQEMERGG